MSSSSPAPSSSYWCYSCSRFVTLQDPTAIICPECDGGFLEAASSPPPPLPSLRSNYMVRDDAVPPPAPATPLPLPSLRSNYMVRDDAVPRNSDLRSRRARRAAATAASPFNPVILLRGTEPVTDVSPGFDLYYDDGEGSGLRPLPPSMSEFLMGSGFDRLLDHLSQIEIGVSPSVPGAASKAAVESMPTVNISVHDSHCAVCTDEFEVGTQAREMPCKHTYHADCILPWLAMRSSCPVCRHEMPAEERSGGEDAPGLTIWRLPGGGFAVGRFAGGRRAAPMVYTEMDGPLNEGSERRRAPWIGEGRSRERRGIAGAVRNFFSFISRRRSSPFQRSRSTERPRRALRRTVSGAGQIWD